MPQSTPDQSSLDATDISGAHALLRRKMALEREMSRMVGLGLKRGDTPYFDRVHDELNDANWKLKNWSAYVKLGGRGVGRDMYEHQDLPMTVAGSAYPGTPAPGGQDFLADLMNSLLAPKR